MVKVILNEEVERQEMQTVLKFYSHPYCITVHPTLYVI